MNNFLSKINKHINLKALLENKKFTVPFSVAVSFILWLIIMINQNPIREQTFNDVSVNVSLENSVAAELGLGIVSNVSDTKFSVKLSGPNYIVSSLKPEDFILTADVSDVNGAGNYKLKVLGVRNSGKTGYTFSSITPSVIDVKFDFFDVKEYPITAKVVGAVAKEGLIAESPIVNGFENGTITVKGPRNIMDKVSSVVAYAEVNKTLDSTQTYNADILIYDKNGDEVDMTNIVLENRTVKVSVPISKKAVLPVKVAFANNPSGLNIKSLKYKVDHSKVTVLGPPDAVNKMKEVSLSPIDFTSISKSSNKFEVSPVLPDGVKLLDNIRHFTVSVDTSDYAEKTLSVTKIEYSGLGQTSTATSERIIKNVKICGPKSDIEKIKASDLYASVDLSDCIEGEYTVDVRIKSKTYTKVWQVGSYTLAVTIK